MADTPLFDKMNHVVVLMFENRSYDHMLGLLDHPKLPTVLDEPLPNPIDPAQPGSPAHTAFELDGYEALTADPKHGFPDVMRQLTGHAEPWKPPYHLKNNGFAWNFHARRGASGTQVLGCYTPRLLPILSTLAREYAVCSRWFCSVPSETWPNRLFAHAATSDNLLVNDERPYTNRTIFEALTHAGRSWQIYAGDIPQVACYRKLWWHDGGPRFSRLDDFLESAKGGHLPNYSFIEPRHFGSACSSQHPLSKVLLGERLLADVYKAITTKKNIWESTLLVITYDEHGGFFDRVHPEPAVPPTPGKKDPKHGFAFDLFGPRVPAVIVSAWTDSLTVDDHPRDHTTIMATLREAFDFDETLTKRDAAATGLAHLLTRDKPRKPVPLPAVPATRGAELGPAEWAEGVAPDGTIMLNDLQQQLINLAQQIERETPAPKDERGREVAPAPQPPFESEAELGEFVEAFRRRQMERM
jgi:phospholipase C